MQERREEVESVLYHSHQVQITVKYMHVQCLKKYASYICVTSIDDV